MNFPLRSRDIFVLLLVMLAFPSAFAFAADYTVAPGDSLYLIGQRYGAAKEALSGADPTKGALYFFESWVPNRFLQSLPVSVVLDSLIFAFQNAESLDFGYGGTNFGVNPI